MSKQIGFVGFLAIIIVVCTNIYSNMTTRKLISVEFEVYGRVQGVFFRKHTQKQAQQLGLKGWCMNTEKGTVQGCVQGEEPSVKNMKQWLKTTGSPQSRIEKVEFSNEKEVKDFNFSEFKIRQ